MAVTKAKVSRYPGGYDVFGGHGFEPFNYTGPSSYSTDGDQLQTGQGGNVPMRYIDTIVAVMSVSGTYYLRAQPTAIGPVKTWNIHWYVTATNAEVGGGVDLSAEKSIITCIGG